MTQHDSTAPAPAPAAPDPLPRVDGDAVAAAVRSGAPVAIVDVRDAEEFAGGHIRGAVNLAASAFGDTAAVDTLIAALEPNKSQVVVHCALSLQRGPKSAAALRQRLQELGVTGKEVVVLDGGFNRFNEAFGSDASVVEKQPPAA